MSETEAAPDEMPESQAVAEVTEPHASGWSQSPLRTKLLLVILLAVCAGLTAATIETMLGNRIWPLLICLVGATAALVHFTRRSICCPLEELAEQLESSCRSRRPLRRADLPTQRGDEIGHIARLLHDLSTDAYRNSAYAKHLRRTIDTRVAESTRRATQQLQQLANRDALTDLGNRRFFDEQYTPLFESCKKSHTELICVAIDLDGFKGVNDTLGHAAGDRLLVFLGNLISASVRREDLAIRLGGDEFLLLMPACPIERAQTILLRLMTLFRQHTHTVLPREIKASLSCGAATLIRDQPLSPQALVEKADANLYAAKQAGKARIVGL